MPLRHRLLLLIVFWGLSGAGWSQPLDPADQAESQTVLRVGAPTPGQPPFIWQDDRGLFRGIYPDVLRLIGDELGVQMRFIPLSQARLVKHFTVGQIDIEPGVSARQQEDQALREQSLFTRPFFTVNEVIIYRPELSFPVFILKDLAGEQVATVRGKPVPGYILRDDLSNELQIAHRVDRGWNRVGLMKEALALHYQKAQALDYEISLPYESNPVSFRLHSDRADWQLPMNRAIDRLKAEGAIESLICKYLCGKSE